LSDRLEILDGFARDIELDLDDSLLIGLEFNSETEFSREESEAIGVAESISKQPNLIKADTVSFSEALLFDVIKGLSDDLDIDEEYYSPTHDIKRIAQKGILRNESKITYLRQSKEK